MLRTNFLGQLLNQMPEALRQQVSLVAPKLLRPEARTPSYFDVLTASITIMQDHITRTRLAGEPPHVMLAPRARPYRLLEFNRAKEAIAAGRSCVEQARPTIDSFL